MKKNLNITPEGTRDYLFKECTAVDYISGKIRAVFENHRFHRVITPALEFYDLFAEDSSGISPESMFKTTDNTGRLIAVRPDSTLPIARMVATRLQNEVFPVRLYYDQAVYRNNPSLTGRSNEIMQLGIELIGSSGKRSDLEVITTALQSMQEISDDFRFELGHSMIFGALESALDAPVSVKEQIETYIENKNYSALNDILDRMESNDTVTAIRKLPSLFGGEEVFEQAEKYIKLPEALEALSYVKNLYSELRTLDCGGSITVDLGLVQRNDYYSGIVFTGFIHGCGDAVLSGGRYDKIFDMYGITMGAAGFAININEIAAHSRFKTKSEKTEVLVFARDDKDIMKAIAHTDKLIKNGVRAQFSVLSDEYEAREFARKLGIPKFEVIGEDI